MTNKLSRKEFLNLGLGTLAGLGAIGLHSTLNSNAAIAATQQRDFSVAGTASLKERAAAKGIIYGGTVIQDLLQDKEFAKSIIQECGIITSEWDFKWSAGGKGLRQRPDMFDFTGSDAIVNFAQTNGLLVRGHTLVWHESLPRWFKSVVTKDNAEAILEEHITKVVGRYAGRMHSWDVVNEAINLSNKRSDGLGASPWLDLLGPNYIRLAFQLAAVADPNALLVYNDYGLNYDTSDAAKKRTAVLKMLENLLSKDTPIHAVGIQAHLSPENPFTPRKLKSFIRDIDKMGLKVMISEMDVIDQKLPGELVQRDNIVANTYEDYLSVVLEEKAVIAVSNWGLSDRYTWLSEYRRRDDGNLVRPLPLDYYMQRKLAWYAMAKAFDKVEKR
jgi:endo-1,4-beta-xylanase